MINSNKTIPGVIEFRTLMHNLNTEPELRAYNQELNNDYLEKGWEVYSLSTTNHDGYMLRITDLHRKKATVGLRSP